MNISQLTAIHLYHGYALQILLAEAIFAWRLKRRTQFPLRCVVGTVLYLALGVVVPNGIACFLPGLFSISIFLLSFFLCVALFDNPVYEILFCCVCAQLTQNLSSNLENLIYLPIQGSLGLAGWFFISVGCMAIVYWLTWIVFSRRTRGGFHLKAPQKFVLPVALLSSLFTYTMQFLFQRYGIDRLWVSRPPLMVCCIFGLSLLFGFIAYSNEREEREKLQFFLEQANRQYEAARTNTEMLNMKAHDLKHYIRRVKDLSGGSEELTEMESVVQEYERNINCGNRTLDAVLTDKLYLCLSKGIDLSIMAEGEKLSFMSPSDVVSLFSNAMDNAIECETGIADSKRRSISLKVFSRADLLCIHVENTCDSPRTIENGLPVTTKADHTLHGFGMKSMQYIVHKYGGELQAGTRDNTFVLNILIPIPKEISNPQ